MITNEVTKKEIIRTMTIKKCEGLIKDMLSKMKDNVDNPSWSMSPCIEVISYYMDCMTVLREEIISTMKEIDQMEKFKYVCY